MSGLNRILATVFLSTLGSLIVMTIYSEAVGLYMPTSAWVATAFCPIVVSTPVAFILVRQGERVRRLNEDLNLAYARLHRLASTDDLTGLANRRAFLETASARREAGAAWILLADIDHFKSINDGFGHERGDAYLQAVAAILREEAGPNGVAGRIGGEEFALLLGAATAQNALLTAETIRERVSSIALPAHDGRIISTTVSVGLTRCFAEGTLRDDLSRADKALYGAKRQGRNQIRVQGAGADRTKQADSVPLAMAS